MNHIRSLFFLSLACLFLVTSYGCNKSKNGPTPEAKTSYMTIGTGGLTGVYYPTGASLCSTLRKYKDDNHIQCNVQSTAGSEYNLNALHKKEIEFGIAQSDVVYRAWEGIEPFREKYDNVRSVFSIYSEPLNLVARKDAGIHELEDIKGKRINIGSPGSGQKRTASDLLQSCNISMEDLALAGGLKPAEMPDGLRDKKLDAYFYTVAHPTANIKDIANSIPISIVPLRGPCVDHFIASNPYYVKARVPGGIYDGVDQDVDTFAVKATLLTHKDTPDAVVYELVKRLAENLQDFKNLHPAYQNITVASMQDGLITPMHPGAKKYFEEIRTKPEQK
ncbi:MAG: TAXI family TRAP transporter solute-binding subunit [Bdellovibrionota bacterium]